MTTFINRTKRASGKFIASSDVVSPEGSKVVVKRIRLTPAGRDALTTQSEGIKNSSSGGFTLLHRRRKKEPEPA